MVTDTCKDVRSTQLEDEGVSLITEIQSHF